MSQRTNTPSPSGNLEGKSEGSLDPKEKFKPLAATDFSEADRKRFWNKVDMRGPDDCWEWNGYRANGYGVFYIPPRPAGVGAHRVSLAIAYGFLNETALACHKCDNPACCNPRHLYAGTRSTNLRDALNRGLLVRDGLHGENHPCVKLNLSQVQEIRKLHGVLSMKKIGLIYGVHASTVHAVISGRLWKPEKISKQLR